MNRYGHRTPAVSDVQPGDRLLFNDRSIPCKVTAVDTFSGWKGTIKVEYQVILCGPQGAEIWLERTSTGRRRVKESTPYGAYANVKRLVRTNG